MKTDSQKLLQELLEQVRDATPKTPGLIYRYSADFVLRHGKWFELKPFPLGTRCGQPKACFGNAIVLAAVHDYKYFEGYALAPDFPMPIHHAWNATLSGDLIDN